MSELTFIVAPLTVIDKPEEIYNCSLNIKNLDKKMNKLNNRINGSTNKKVVN